RRLARGADEEEEADEPGDVLQQRAVLLDGRHVERPDAVAPEGRDHEEEAEEEARVADAVHEERLLPRRGVLRLLVPEADQEVGAEAHPLPADEDVEEHAEGGERHDPAEPRRLAHHRSVASSSTFVVSRFRNMERMIASPTAASAAATVITKKTITCPSIEPVLRASATKLRLTAFSMSSIAMKMTITLRRMSTPSNVIVIFMAKIGRAHV